MADQMKPNQAVNETGSDPFEVPVDGAFKSMEFRPFKLAFGILPYPHCGKRKSTSPHMRAFWSATLCFMFAFVGWFAFAPLLVYVRKDIGICENNDEVQLDIENVKCSCKVGSDCRATITTANIAGVSFDVFTRFMLGSVIEKFGPRLTDCGLLLWGAIVVGCSAAITSGPGLITVRFFVSALGSSFVVNQFWNTIMFNPSIVGTANATAGGWGNLGGGLTQLLMVIFYKFFHDGLGASLGASWRLAMLCPATIYVILATWIFMCSQDMASKPGRMDINILGKSRRAGFWDYIRILKDINVVLMIMQYGACFGCELTMNTTLALHFTDNFDVSPVVAGAMALTFGGMNLFARSLGGILSDYLNVKRQMQGRLWAHFIALFGQAIFLFLFGCVDKSIGAVPAVIVLAIFSIFVNAAEGTSYGIVPYMIPTEVAVVSAMVGAGGTLGAPIALQSFFRFFDNFTAYKLYSVYVMFWALTVLLMRWDHMGSMFWLPTESTPAAPEKVTVAPAPPKIAFEVKGEPLQDSEHKEAKIEQGMVPGMVLE